MHLWRAGRWAALTAAAMLAGCGFFGPDARIRYRVTVEVQTPQGVKTASSVWQSDATEGSGIPDTALRMRAKGEAVAVDLPGGTLFALMRGQDMGVDYVHYAIGRHLGRHHDPSLNQTGNWRSDAKNFQNSKLSFNLDPDEYPLLVRFHDIADPASVEKVDPANLAASFGPGVYLKRITVAVTDDGVTDGILTRIPWLPDQRGSFLKVPTFTPRSDRPLAARLNEGDFLKD